MRRLGRFTASCAAKWILALVIGGAWANSICYSTASADEHQIADALSFIPEESLGAVVFNRLDNINGPFIKVAANLGLDLMGPHVLAVKLLQAQPGLNEKGVAVFAAMPSMSDRLRYPFLYVAVPVSDFGKYEGRFSTEDLGDGFVRVRSFDPRYAPDDIADSGVIVWITKKRDYALLMLQPGLASESSDAQREVRNRVKKLVIDRTAELPAAIAKSEDWLAHQDIGVVVTIAGVKQAMSAMQKDPATFAWIEKEVSQFFAGVRIDADGTLRFAGRTQFADGGQWQELAGKVPDGNNTPTAGLPTGSYLAAFEGVVPSESSRFLRDYTTQMIKQLVPMVGVAPLTEDESKRLAEELAQSVEGVRSVAVHLGTSKPSESFCNGITSVIEVDDSSKYLRNVAKAVDSLIEIVKATGYPGFIKYHSRLTEVKRAASYEFTVDISDLVKSFAKQQGNESKTAFIQALFGADGKAGLYLQTIDANTVGVALSAVENLDRVVATVESPGDGLAANADVKSTLSQLPKGSQWTMLIGPSGVMSCAQSVLKALFAVPDVPAQTKLREVPPAGIAARLEREALEIEVVVPSATIEGLKEALRKP